jgi:hypothetical protein
VKKYGEISLAGITFPSPSNQCWSEPVPYIFKHGAMQLLQQPDKITILYNEDHEVRWVRLNEPHRTPPTPSWHGDSVAHYEGDTLVIDTVGVKTDRPFAMIDLFGALHQGLHVVERYTLLDYEAAKARWNAATRSLCATRAPQPQLYRQVPADPSRSRMKAPSRRRGPPPSLCARPRRMAGVVCAENRYEYYNHKVGGPRADKPDFDREQWAGGDPGVFAIEEASNGRQIRADVSCLGSVLGWHFQLMLRMTVRLGQHGNIAAGGWGHQDNERDRAHDRPRYDPGTASGSLDNTFGLAPVVFGKASIGPRVRGAALAAGTIKTLTFGGSGSVTVPAGATVSDPISFHVDAQQDIAVSLFVALPMCSRASTPTPS